MPVTTFKPPVWETPDKVLAQSGHTVWDRQVMLLTPGQHEDEGLRSVLIRSVDTVRTGRARFGPGELRDQDLAQLPDLPEDLRERVLEATRESSVLVYELRHFAGKLSERKRIVHGYIVTRLDGTFLAALADGPTHRSQVVVRYALPYLAHSIPRPWDEDTSRQLFDLAWPEPKAAPQLAGV